MLVKVRTLPEDAVSLNENILDATSGHVNSNCPTMAKTCRWLIINRNTIELLLLDTDDDDDDEKIDVLSFDIIVGPLETII